MIDRLKIFLQEYQSYSRISLLGLVFLVPFLSGFFVYDLRLKSSMSVLQIEHDKIMGEALTLIYSRLGDMRHTIQLLAYDRQLASSLSQKPIDSASVHDVFTSFNEVVDQLMQLRWIDESGQEQVRVDVLNGKAFPVDELQNKADRYYYIEGMKTPEGKVYFSPIDLNVERGEIQIPYQPTVRVALKTIQSTNTAGLLILNYNLTDLFKELVRLVADSNSQTQLLMANPEGYWMIHPETDKLWGDQLSRKDATIAQESPEVWSLLQTSQAVSNFESAMGVTSAQPVSLNYVDKSKDAFIFALTPTEVVNGYRLAAFIPAAVVGGILFVLGMALLNRDVSQQRKQMQLYQELQQDQVLLKEASAKQRQLLEAQTLLQDDLLQARKLSSLGMMVAGVAHELNTPIGSAMLANSRNQTELAKLRQAFETGLSKQTLENYLAETEEGTGLIEKSLERSAGLVSSFKRMAIDRANEEIVTYSIADVVHDLLNTLKPKLKLHSMISIDVQVPDSISLEGYPGVLSQVLQNLLVNALEHGFRSQDAGKISITAEQFSDKTVLRFEDNGQGIPEELRATLFDPFVTSKRHQGNTGLGMHFVHQWVVEVLKGRIQVESSTGKNSRTCFTISLPNKTPTLAI